jgi:cardiolipin synthase
MSTSEPPALQPGHHITLLQGSAQFFAALIEAIEQSVKEVRLETYIFDVTASGERVAQALEQAAQRGVSVFLMLDGVGTPALHPHWQKRFNQAGVRSFIFLPLGRLGLLMPRRWRRLHRKLCVVDGQTAFCGGINVLDDFHDPNHGHLAAPRLDFAVRVSGPLVQIAHQTMAQFWWRWQAVGAARQSDFKTTWRTLQRAFLQHRHNLATTAFSQPAHNTIQAGLLLRDNLRHRAHIEHAYDQAIGNAKQEIIIANAYFLPGRVLRQALIQAAKRGVRVRLLLQGRYEYFMQYHASRPVYQALLSAGVEIYEYTKSFLHAKVAVIDGHWATVGSSNLDPLSLLLAREADVVIDDCVLAQTLRQRLEEAIGLGSQSVALGHNAQRPWHLRWRDQLAFGLMRLMIYLSGNHY